MRKLTPKQERFVHEYLIDLNATQAAIRAGYSERTARQVAAENLSKPDIQAAIDACMKARETRTGITADRVLAELALIGFSDMGQILDFTGDVPRLKKASEIAPEARRLLQAVKVKRYLEGKGDDATEVEVTEFKLWSKDNALHKLAQHLGLLVEKHEHTGKDGGPIELEHGTGFTPPERFARLVAILRSRPAADPPGKPQSRRTKRARRPAA